MNWLDLFNSGDISGMVVSFANSHDNLIEDLEEVKFDKFISDYIDYRNSISSPGTLFLDPATQVILSMWVSGDSVGIRFIPGSDRVRFATSDEIFKVASESNDVYIKLQDLRDFYKKQANGRPKFQFK